MAEQCAESSVAVVAAASSTPNWWPDFRGRSSGWSTSSTNTTNHHHSWHQINPNSNSSCEDDVSISTSFTNASNHSSLSVDSARLLVEGGAPGEMIGETASDSHLWSHVLLSSGNNGEMQNTSSTNFVEALSSKNLSNSMFEPPACDYLKKMDNGWDITTTSSSFNSFEKQFNIEYNNNSLNESGKLCNLVSHWSIAPPADNLQQFDPQSSNTSLLAQQHSHSNDQVCQMIKPILVNHNRRGLFGSFSSNFHGLKVEDDHSNDREIDDGDDDDDDEAAAGTLFPRHFRMPFDNNNDNVIPDDFPRANSSSNRNSGRNLEDILSFNGLSCKTLTDNNNNSSKSFLRTLNLSDTKELLLQTASPKLFQSTTISTTPSPQVRNNRTRGHGITNEAKKKRSEGNSETLLKKPRHENSTFSSSKMQVPKVKLGDKITALQQIVSPFGKTDTASVLWEAIGYIKFLQEQVQLLSNPYMKTNAAAKDPWGVVLLDRKGGHRADAKRIDLKSRGLCLVPISFTPQVYRENSGSDYWPPAYRGCLYR